MLHGATAIYPREGLHGSCKKRKKGDGGEAEKSRKANYKGVERRRKLIFILTSISLF